MQTFNYSATFPVTAEVLFDWHKRKGAFERLTPPWAGVRVMDSNGGIEAGGWVKIKTPPLGLIKWELIHGAYAEGKVFTDQALKGPFKYWKHGHHFSTNETEQAVLKETIDYDLPKGLQWLHPFVEGELKRQFKARMERLAAEVLSPGLEVDVAPLVIAITGARGLIGSALIPLLTLKGHTVRSLVRHKEHLKANEYAYNARTGEGLVAALTGCDAVIHLAGESIAGYWTCAKKEAIRFSRERGTQVMAEAIQQLPQPPRVFIMASAAGYYGETQAPVDEGAPKGQGFLADVVAAWEAAAQPIEALGVRVVKLRLGAVLSPNGGMLKAMLPSFQMGLGSIFGTGKALLSWVSIEDVVLVFYRALMDEAFQGAINVGAPEPISRSHFAQLLGHVLARPVWLKLPEKLMCSLGGEVVQELCFKNNAVRPHFLESQDYVFRDAHLESALRRLLGK